jgi:hypothetical protein
MKIRQLALPAFALALLAALAGGSALPAQEKTAPKKVSGILVEKGDDWVKVKADGEADAVKYSIDPSSKKTAAALTMALKGVSTASRVRVTWKGDDERILASINKIPTTASGMIKGEVLATHDWWIEVKPKGKVPDGYAVRFPEKNKAMMDQVKALQKGDIVIIQFGSDRERHVIQTLKVAKSSK